MRKIIQFILRNGDILWIASTLLLIIFSGSFYFVRIKPAIVAFRQALNQPEQITHDVNTALFEKIMSHSVKKKTGRNFPASSRNPFDMR